MSGQHEFLKILSSWQRCSPYCDCDFPRSSFLASYKGYIPDLIKCRCGEDESYALEWLWDQSADSVTQISGKDITFHPIYSQGTAIVRGEKPLETGMIHFWEMRVITALSGTDIMFGIGTDKVDLNEYKFLFASALGTNTQSWGFSFHGILQHNGVQKRYGQKFSQGCIIGIYLDRSRGYIEIYLNRQSLGIAYQNISIDPNVVLYPMVCSTAAKSVIHLMNATSQRECLQFRAFEALCKQPSTLKKLQDMPGFRIVLKRYWFLNLPIRYSRHSSHSDSVIADEAVLSKSILACKHKYQDDEVDITDLYSNDHIIAREIDVYDDVSVDYFDVYDEYPHFHL